MKQSLQTPTVPTRTELSFFSEWMLYFYFVFTSKKAQIAIKKEVISSTGITKSHVVNCSIMYA